MSAEWWKDAVIYAVDVERFCDGNGDGTGDFVGLAAKLPHIVELGATCLWLLPFYPSGGRDNGYDVTDYLGVDPKYGTLEDFLAFMREAGEHGIRVLMDLVLAHTSDRHPWFQASRHDPRTLFRDWYIWSSQPPPTPAGDGPAFPGKEDSLWTHDDVAHAFYFHRFHKFQPSLNYDSRRVREAMKQAVDFWQSFGVSGFRVDAAALIAGAPPVGSMEDTALPHEVLRDLFRQVERRDGDAVLLGEVDESWDKMGHFFDGRQMNMMFNFPLSRLLLLALVEESAEPVRRAFERLPKRPGRGQWANFLRNLDEANIGRLAEKEKQRVFRALAPRKDMRAFGRGIRRRLAPMLGGKLERLKLAWSLLFSLPGAPMLVYGDEIGMGDNLARPGREAVRAPMQWSGARNAGFSTARKSRLANPLIESGPYAYAKINVEEQKGREDSLLSFVRALIRARREHSEIGSGACEFLDVGSGCVLAHRCRAGRRSLLAFHNLAGRPESIALPEDTPQDWPSAVVIGEKEEPRRRGGQARLELEPWGFRWLAW